MRELPLGPGALDDPALADFTRLTDVAGPSKDLELK